MRERDLLVAQLADRSEQQHVTIPLAEAGQGCGQLPAEPLGRHRIGDPLVVALGRGERSSSGACQRPVPARLLARCWPTRIVAIP